MSQNTSQSNDFSSYYIIISISWILLQVILIVFLCAPYDFIEIMSGFTYDHYPSLPLNLGDAVDNLYLITLCLILIGLFMIIFIMSIECECFCGAGENMTTGNSTLTFLGVGIGIDLLMVLLHLLGNFHYFFYYHVGKIESYHFQLSFQTFLSSLAGLILLLPPLLVLIIILASISACMKKIRCLSVSESTSAKSTPV